MACVKHHTKKLYLLVAESAICNINAVIRPKISVKILPFALVLEALLKIILNGLY